MASISPEKARTYGLCTVISAWLAVFCLFGYRSSFSIMQKMIIADTGWTTMQVSLGYCLMMTIYAITAFFSGSLVDKRGCRPTYAIGAVTCFLGFFLTSMVNVASPSGFYLYLFTYGVFAGVGTGYAVGFFHHFLPQMVCRCALRHHVGAGIHGCSHGAADPDAGAQACSEQ